jgi:hypothetical protein
MIFFNRAFPETFSGQKIARRASSFFSRTILRIRECRYLEYPLVFLSL